MTGHSQGQLVGHSQDQLFLTQKFKILNFKTLSAGLFTTRVHGRVTLAVSSLVKCESTELNSKTAQITLFV